MEKIHAYEPSYNDFYKLLIKILDSNEDELKKLGIKNSRLDTIKPGVLILIRVFKKFKINSLITSGVGVREGVFLTDLLRNSKDKFPANFNTSIKYILDSHIDNLSHSNQICSVAKKLFDLMHEELEIDVAYRYELGIAAKLCMSGSTIHYYSHNKHSYNLIEDALEFGFTHKQIVLIATLARYAKKRLPPIFHTDKYKELLPDINQLNSLSYILSLSVALLSHHPLNIDFTLRFEDSELKIESKNSMYLAKDNIKKLENLENFTVTFL